MKLYVQEAAQTCTDVSPFYSRHKKGGMNNRVQSRIIKRIKHFVGYPDATKEEIASEGFEFILTDMEHYGLGKIRTWDDYMKFANLSVDTKNKAIACAVNSWCNQGQKDWIIVEVQH